MNAPKGMKISPKECTALTFCWLIEKIDLVMIFFFFFSPKGIQ